MITNIKYTTPRKINREVFREMHTLQGDDQIKNIFISFDITVIHCFSNRLDFKIIK